ncbi:MAG: type I glyceraldehyde-3-phosphate dehydrogenase [Bacteroidetes bacterium]|nr:type I glyceraldehyde-3-phosphate dehydrogenase [Bacteroidota bacterium]
MIKVAINGFGRIGRIAFRCMMQHSEIEIVAINDLADVHTLTHLLRYDSVHGRFPFPLENDNEAMCCSGRRVLVLTQPDPLKLPWKELGIDIVIESTGMFTAHDQAAQHLKAGARKVIISAPASDEDQRVPFYVIGVNHHTLDKSARIISNASCTTNNVAPLIMILDRIWGIREGFITTVHSYTRDQLLVDGPHKDWRKGRAAATSIVPTTTGAAKAATRIFPHLRGKLGGAGIRVPVPDGSLTDLTCTLRQPADIEAINRAFRDAAEGELKGILEYTDHPIVSVDVIGNTHSAVFDARLTVVLGEDQRLVKVVAWYDNEMGYASRLAELVKLYA